MNLGELSKIVFSFKNDEYTFTKGFGKPASYRGYYYEVCFEPKNNVSVKELKVFIGNALTDTFTGWKGGEYRYDENTPVHLAFAGESADEYGGNDMLLRITQMREEYDSNNSVKKVTKRKTKAEKLAEWNAEMQKQREEEAAEFVKTYQTRLLNLIHGYLQESPNNVHAYPTYFRFDFTGWQSQELPLVIGDDVNVLMKTMDSLEYELTQMVSARNAAEELYQKKQAALAKLTAQERDLLGL